MLACTATAEYFDGNPLFFPLDGAVNVLDEPRYPATIAPAFGFNFAPEPGGALHNFYFTSEIRFKVRYSGVNSAAFQLTTDDDGWIFINGRLAVDLGGKHTPSLGSVTIGDSFDSFGLSDGDIYEVAVFHADRSASGSAIALYLTALDWVPSCFPTD